MLWVIFRGFVVVLLSCVFLFFAVYPWYVFKAYVEPGFYCNGNYKQNYCDDYVKTNITLVGHNNGKYIGEYLYYDIPRQCVIHEYDGSDKIGYSFIGYYDFYILEKCYEYNYYKSYIDEQAKSYKASEIFIFVFIHLILMGCILIPMCMLYKNLEPTVGNNFHHIYSPIYPDIELGNRN